MPKHVAAVAITITAVAPTAPAPCRATQAGEAPGRCRRTCCYRAGRTSVATAIVRVSSSGKIAVFNTARSGSTQVDDRRVRLLRRRQAVGRDPRGAAHACAAARPRRSAIGAHRTLTAISAGMTACRHRASVRSRCSITAAVATKSGRLIAYQAGGPRPHAARPPSPEASTAPVRDSSPPTARSDLALQRLEGRSGRRCRGRLLRRRDRDDGRHHAGGAAARIVEGARRAAQPRKTVTVTGRDGVPRRHITAVLVNLQARSKR